MEKNLTIQLFRLVASIMVIAIHTNPFAEISGNLAYIIRAIIVRVAVPFFFSLTGYLYAKKNEKDYVKKYVMKILKLYTIWGSIYLPYLIFSVKKNDEKILSQFFIIIKKIILEGVYFHLWFLPALIFAIIFFDLLYKKISLLNIGRIAIFLYIVGLFGTSYYGILSGNLKYIMDIYIKIFISTRNGLFMGFPFLVLGVVLGKRKLTKFTYKKVVTNIFFFYFLLALEVIIISKRNYIKIEDTYLVLPILIYYIMIFSINDFFKEKSAIILKLFLFEDFSLGIYLVHGIFLIIYKKIFIIMNLKNINTFYFFIVMLSSVLSIWFLKKVVKMKKYI